VAKINKNIDIRNKTPNLTSVFNEIKHYPSALISLLSKYYNISFAENGKKFICTQHTGIKIEPVKAEKSVWTVNNYSNALDIPSGQIKTQCFNLTKHLAGIDQVLKQVEILESLGLLDSDTPKTPTKLDHIAQISTKSKITPQSTTNENEGLKMPNFTTYSTPYGKTVLSFLQNKTGATVETLEKYQVLPTKSKDELRYSYKVCLTVKSKYPHRQKVGKYGTYFHTSKYLFGFNQLPKQGKYLIVASGEDDTICINHNLNHLGIFAVCGWNETTTPPSDLLDGLKTRFEHCFVLGDNDNPQTTKASKRIANEIGFVWIDTSNARAYFGMPNEWDICDIHQQRDQVKDFVLFCLGANHRLTSYEDDPDSMAIDHCYKLDFAQHIGQEQPNKYGIKPLDFILHQIKEHDRLILESLAGTGKSTVLTKIVHQSQRSQTPQSVAIQVDSLISPNLETLSKLGIDRVIILEPTTAINAQLPEAFKEVGLTVAAIDNLADENDLQTALQSRVLMVCYDSLKKVYHLLTNALVIVDEYHQLPIDINFRSPTAFRLVIDGLEKAKKVLLLSATPNYLFTLPKEVYSGFGYKLIKGVPSVQNQIIIQPFACEGKRMDIPSYIFENSPKEQGLITIKFDSKANLGAFTISVICLAVSHSERLPLFESFFT